MKYKVGDRVLIRQWDDMEREFGGGVYSGREYISCETPFSKGMKKFCGKIMEIKKYFCSRYIMKDGEDYWFSDDMIERKVDGMTKNDLKTGHIVTLRDGSEFSVVLDVGESFGVGVNLLINSHDHKWDSLNNYTDDMRHIGEKKLDIIKVRNSRLYSCIGNPNDDVCGDVFYERKDQKEMTVADIEKELGYSVKIVKE